VNQKLFDITPILLVRPWEKEPYFAREIHRLDYAYKTVPVAIKAGGDRLRVPRVAYRLYSILNNGFFDVVHTHGYFADICGLPAARLIGIRSISTCHGFIANDRKLNFYNWLDTYALRLCKTVIAVSQDIKDKLVHSGIKPSRVVVIPNAVASTSGKDKLQVRRQERRKSLGFAPDDYVVGYLGRLSEEKGLKYLIEAIAELRNAYYPLKLLIVGDGPERQALEQLVNSRGLETITVFAGFQEDIESWLSVFDVFILPSITEGTPLALLESMAIGVPVLATAVGGVPKVITSGFNGMLLSPGNPREIGEKIKWLKDRPDLMRQFGRAGIDTIKARYSIDKWCRSIESHYYQI
jgi:glycosyltransferase involved in cell wall biosynthesis